MVPHVVVSLWGIPRRVLRALVIWKGLSGKKESRVQEMRMRTRARNKGRRQGWGVMRRGKDGVSHMIGVNCNNTPSYHPLCLLLDYHQSFCLPLLMERVLGTCQWLSSNNECVVHISVELIEWLRNVHRMIQKMSNEHGVNIMPK